MKLVEEKSVRILMAECISCLYMRIFKVTFSDQDYPNFLEILEKAYPESANENKDCKLEILEAIPTTMREEKIVIEDEIRSDFVGFVISNLQCPVMELISQVSEEQGMHNRRKYQIVMCFESWLNLDASSIVKQNLHKLRVIGLCFDILMEVDSCNQEASEALMSVMVVCKNTNEYRDLYGLILQKLVEAQERVIRFDDEQFVEEVRCYIDVYNVFIVNSFDNFLAQPDDPIIYTLLYHTIFHLFKSKSHLTVSRIIGVFISIMKKLEDEDGEISTVEKINARSTFIKIHKELFNGIVELCCYQATFTNAQMSFYQTKDFYEDPDDIDHEDKRKIRDDIKNLLRRISTKTSFTDCMSPIAKRLIATLDELKKKPTDKLEKLYCKLESELFCAYSLIKSADNLDKLTLDTIYSLLTIVLGIDVQVSQLIHICIKIIGASSPFISEMKAPTFNKTQLLDQCFIKLAKWVTEDKLEESACHSFYCLCKDNRGHITKNFKQFMDCKLL